MFLVGAQIGSSLDQGPSRSVHTDLYNNDLLSCPVFLYIDIWQHPMNSGIIENAPHAKKGLLHTQGPGDDKNQLIFLPTRRK